MEILFALLSAFLLFALLGLALRLVFVLAAVALLAHFLGVL